MKVYKEGDKIIYTKKFLDDSIDPDVKDIMNKYLSIGKTYTVSRILLPDYFSLKEITELVFHIKKESQYFTELKQYRKQKLIKICLV